MVDCTAVVEKLYSMKVGDYFKDPRLGDYFTVIRVPGGWIYQNSSSMCFVPFIDITTENREKNG